MTGSINDLSLCSSTFRVILNQGPMSDFRETSVKHFLWIHVILKSVMSSQCDVIELHNQEVNCGAVNRKSH